MRAMGSLKPVSLALALVLLALAGCDGTERDSPSGSSAEPTLLFLAGDGELTIVDVDSASAEVHSPAELAAGDPQYRIVRRADKLVVYGGDNYVLDPSLRTPPKKLGDSWFFIPSARPDRVWLAILDPASSKTVRALAALREVSVGGLVTFPGR
jgi:hypothetical protein